MERTRGTPSTRFTLVELVVVIAIIVILMAFLVPVFQQARAKAKQTSCTNQLAQFGLAMINYQSDTDGAMPNWLSSLYKDYVGTSNELYVCPQDPSSGFDGNRPGAGWGSNDYNGSPIMAYGKVSPDGNRDQYDIINQSAKDEFFYVDDTSRNNERRTTGNEAVENCSYLYEFADTECLWAPASMTGWTWGQVKEEQLSKGLGRHADFEEPGEPWTPELFPAARCFYHWSVLWGKNELVLNVSYAGNVFLSRLRWEDGTY